MADRDEKDIRTTSEVEETKGHINKQKKSKKKKRKVRKRRSISSGSSISDDSDDEYRKRHSKKRKKMKKKKKKKKERRKEKTKKKHQERHKRKHDDLESDSAGEDEGDSRKRAKAARRIMGAASSEAKARAGAMVARLERQGSAASAAIGVPGGGRPQEQLDETDYFRKCDEFRVWLLQARGIYLEEMPSEDAKRIFRKKFVAGWNKGSLPTVFYTGIDTSALSETSFTRHKWSFANRLSAADEWKAQSVRDNVNSQTNTNYEQSFQRRSHASSVVGVPTSGKAKSGTRPFHRRPSTSTGDNNNKRQRI